MFFKTIFGILYFSLPLICVAGPYQNIANAVFDAASPKDDHPMTGLVKNLINISYNGWKVFTNITKDIFESGKEFFEDGFQTISNIINEKLQFETRSLNKLGHVLSNIGNQTKNLPKEKDGSTVAKLFPINQNILDFANLALGNDPNQEEKLKEIVSNGTTKVLEYFFHHPQNTDEEENENIDEKPTSKYNATISDDYEDHY